ncbi:PEP-CTERM sorting domain-containing protein [Methylobacter sp.]|uniref:PEP-CTERM sorting domain-containing protein n=1 Tax=Methylobacter sp. TaxID=2051955 RepID=UPI00121DFD73|nr:PEP-CTERM sorting domain-containing protein [Methylobacter sp.]TAK61285.1 MAG: PEP-CTERM sorting domain-containing protein [Methylobacter sp.]
MKTKKLTASAAALAAVMGLAAASSANAFTIYPGQNLLEDDDFESQVVDTNGNNQLDVGDTLEGIVNITKIVGQSIPGLPFNNVLGSGTQLAAIFKTEVTSRTDIVPGFANYSFGTKTGETSIFKFFALNAETFPSSGGCTSFAACETLLTAGASAWWEFGFTGDADEEWNSTNTPVNPDIFTGVSTSLALGNFKFALGLIDKHNAPDLKLVDLDCLPGILYNCAGDGKVQLAASGSVLGTKEILAQNPNFPYTVSSDTDFHINVVPEPTSLALLGAGLFGFGFRQRKNQA